MSDSSGDYVLGTGEEELVRLGLQHRIWSASAFALWERAGFVPGMRVLDAGCGPGYTTLDLAEIVGPEGWVVGVDAAARFTAHLRQRVAQLGIRQVEVVEADLERLELEPAAFDAAYARWVLCYVRDPGEVVRRIVAGLRRGGVLAVQDYYHYLGITVAPPDPATRRVFEAVDRSWRMRGGDGDVGQRLPALMEAAGLRVREVRPLVRIARPGSLLWQWPTTFFRNYLPVLEQMGLLRAEESEAFRSVWAERSRDPGAFFATPPMVEIVGEKR